MLVAPLRWFTHLLTTRTAFNLVSVWIFHSGSARVLIFLNRWWLSLGSIGQPIEGRDTPKEGRVVKCWWRDQPNAQQHGQWRTDCCTRREGRISLRVFHSDWRESLGNWWHQEWARGSRQDRRFLASCECGVPTPSFDSSWSERNLTSHIGCCKTNSRGLHYP